MGNDQYVQHDWGYLTWSLLLTLMVLGVAATMGLFLFMVERAGRATARRGDAGEDPISVAGERNARPQLEESPVEHSPAA